MAKPDPQWPMPNEGILYLLKGDDAKLAIDLYSKRMQVSATTAEDTIRAYLLELGFELGGLYIPRKD